MFTSFNIILGFFLTRQENINMPHTAYADVFSEFLFLLLNFIINLYNRDGIIYSISTFTKRICLILASGINMYGYEIQDTDNVHYKS